MKVKNNMRYRDFFNRWYFWVFFIIMLSRVEFNYISRETIIGGLIGLLLGTWIFFILGLLIYRIIIKIFKHIKK